MSLQTLIDNLQETTPYKRNVFPFSGHVLKQSASLDEFGEPIWYTTLCLLFAWTVVAMGLVRGVQSLGKVRP